MRRTVARHFLTLETLNPAVLKAEYAVRGPIVARSQEILKEMKAGVKFPFDEVIECNIGNPQALMQEPLSFPRQVLSLVVNPKMIDDPRTQLMYPQDAITRARKFVESIGHWTKTGAYTDSKGYAFVRKEVAQFIEKRDNTNAGKALGECDPESIMLSNGASPGVAIALQALLHGNGVDGCLTPIPQYPLYSATLTLMGAHILPYYLDESKGWATSIPSLEAALKKANDAGIKTRALVIINPGNPTGQVLDANVIDEVIGFAHRHKIVLLADEVYQENVYAPKKKFHSFRERLLAIGGKIAQEQQLISFHSISKGIIGECGRRGGYTQYINIPHDAFTEIVKLPSVRLCPNVDGQLYTALMLNPPREGELSYETDRLERSKIFNSLVSRAQFLEGELNAIPGITSQPIEGAMYAFPKLTLPKEYVDYAVKKGKTPATADALWAMELLENTGVLVVPGSGFGQEPGTYHFRTTILPQRAQLEKVVEKINGFQRNILAGKFGIQK